MALLIKHIHLRSKITSRCNCEAACWRSAENVASCISQLSVPFGN